MARCGPAWSVILATLAAGATAAQDHSVGDVPACRPIVGRPCPTRDQPDGLGEGKGFCEEVPPTAVRGRCRVRKAGCAGLTRGLCKHVCAYCRSLVEGSICRMTSIAEDPNDACGHRGMQLEWEPVALEARPGSASLSYPAEAPAFVVLTGRAAGPDGPSCAGGRTCVACTAPRLSPLDNCYTHADRDFILDLVVGDEALPFLSPANMIADGSHAGRDLDLEAEWMYLFAPFRSVWLFEDGDEKLARPRALPPRLPWTRSDGAREELGVPVSGDTVAVAGVLAADCGHLNARGFPRTEIHPALALAWLHEEGSGRFSLSIRAMSHAPGDRQRLALGAFRAALPLPGPGRVVSFHWDYLWRGYQVVVDRSCGKGDEADHSQERPAAHPSDVDQSEVVKLNRSVLSPEALHENRWYAIRVRAQGASVEIDLRRKTDEDPPVLIGVHAEIELP